MVRIKDYLEGCKTISWRGIWQKARNRAGGQKRSARLKTKSRLMKSVDLNDMPKIRTGPGELDRAICGLYLGQVSPVVGQAVAKGKAPSLARL